MKELKIVVNECPDGDEFVVAHGKKLSDILNSLLICDWVDEVLARCMHESDFDYIFSRDDISGFCISAASEVAVEILIDVSDTKSEFWEDRKIFNVGKEIINEIFCFDNELEVNYYAVVE